MASVNCLHNSGVCTDPDVPVRYQLSGVPIPPLLLFPREAEDSNRKLEALGDRARWIAVND